ncbi:hypothetical protein GZH53_00825 [Flavihumibacter sp. R14]|nr:hypothetical protein [Flavihumibacter soli]
MKRHIYLLFVLAACNNAEQLNKKEGDSENPVKSEYTISNLEYNEQQKKLRKTIGKIDSLVATAPDKGEFYYLRGEANFISLNFESAILDFKKSIKLGYNKGKAYSYISDIYGIMDQGDSSSYYLNLSEREHGNEVPESL